MELKRISFALEIAQLNIPFEDEYGVILMMDYILKFSSLNGHKPEEDPNQFFYSHDALKKIKFYSVPNEIDTKIDLPITSWKLVENVSFCLDNHLSISSSAFFFFFKGLINVRMNGNLDLAGLVVAPLCCIILRKSQLNLPSLLLLSMETLTTKYCPSLILVYSIFIFIFYFLF